MEMENINENTIRVLIENSDLEERGITFLDLLGNQKQIESFFYSILEEVDVDNQFHESDAITFQVLPNGNGLELFISKGMNNEDDFDMANGSNQLEHVVDYIKNRQRVSTHVIKRMRNLKKMIWHLWKSYLNSRVLMTSWSWRNECFWRAAYLRFTIMIINII